jgi:hypothetical protein
MFRIFEINASIIGSNPPIYRKIKLNGDYQPSDYSRIMQALFNWGVGNVHLHYFRNTDGNIIKNEDAGNYCRMC